MFEKNKYFDLEDKKLEDIQNNIEGLLKTRLLYSTTSTRLGKSLLRINYFDKNIEIGSQKENRITILEEKDKKIYIQIAGVLDNVKVGQLWEGLENFFSTESINIIKDPIITPEEIVDKSEESIEIIEILPSKDELVEDIKKSLESKGYNLEVEEIEIFIGNFIEKYNRLPVPSELKAIIKGYILMIQEENKVKSQITEPIIEESQEEVSSEIHQDKISQDDLTKESSSPENLSQGEILSEENIQNIISQDDLTKELSSPENLNQEQVSSEENIQEILPQDEITKELSSHEKINQEEEPKEEFPINKFDEVVLSKQWIAGRRRCPNCGNEGSIREVDDKTKILMHSPRIYSKKKSCGQCGYEWHGD